MLDLTCEATCSTAFRQAGPLRVTEELMSAARILEIRSCSRWPGASK